MPSFWGIRTSKERHDLLRAQLESGLLRQGWGARNLREIGADVERGAADDEARSIWRYTRRMLEIERGDIVLTPHQPDWNRHGGWRVEVPYEFDPLPDVWGPGLNDFGHVLRVKPLGVIDHRSALVSSELRRALTSGFRTRMRDLSEHGSEIERLLGDPAAALASDAEEHFEVVRRGAREALYQGLIGQYGSADFEKPIGAMLEALYPNAVRHSAGRSEEGRDFVVDDVDLLGLSRRVVVQVKSWHGEVSVDDLMHGLHQLERGITAEDGGVDLCVLLTLANKLPPDADKAIAMTEQETSVRVRVLLRDETLDLLLNQLAHMRLGSE